MKSKMSTILALALLAWTLTFATASHATEEFKGSWTILSSKEPGQVHFGLAHRRDGNNSQHEADWPVGVFQGLDLAASGKHDVQFSIVRDAGRFNCEGFLNDGEGAGVFSFAPDANYSKSMSSLGFAGIDTEKQFAMAVHDVTLEFARTMKAERVSGLDTDKLIAFRIFNVTPQFIHDLRTEGLAATDSDKLVAFRIHGVTPAIVREVRKSGLEASEDQLVAFRIHGVSPEFIAKVEGLGFKHPEPDQLVAMRIHGVTPEYIADLKSRGMKNLTIDQLVNLRIHGID